MATRIVPKTKSAMTSFPNTAASRDSAPLKHPAYLETPAKPGAFFYSVCRSPPRSVAMARAGPYVVVEVEARACPLR
jgi:hypothetical protein